MAFYLSITAALLVAITCFVVLIFFFGGISKYFDLRESDAAEVIESQAFERPLWWKRVVDRLGERLPAMFRSRMTELIRQAGGLRELRPAELLLFAFLTTSASIFLGILLALAGGFEPAWVVFLAVLSALLPFIWLRDQVKKRHAEMLRDLPFHIDLLTLCVEAGLDFVASIQRMVEQGRDGALVEEFRTLLAEIRMGRSRAKSLESMRARIGLAPLSSLLGALIQADRMGTSMAKTLRAQSEQIRNERYQRAETLANQAPVKMLFPLMVFIFPTIWIILAAPMIFSWMFR